jgi:hypothetical protein
MKSPHIQGKTMPNRGTTADQSGKTQGISCKQRLVRCSKAPTVAETLPTVAETLPTAAEILQRNDKPLPKTTMKPHGSSNSLAQLPEWASDLPNAQEFRRLTRLLGLNYQQIATAWEFSSKKAVSNIIAGNTNLTTWRLQRFLDLVGMDEYLFALAIIRKDSVREYQKHAKHEKDNQKHAKQAGMHA